ncbi:MAG: hypothetical protein IB618_02985 [Candidatus Pacearchaeota archaeon]|nr:MAG: hypothetical protein IB618_02985 [Candidatus Pacearchaeota archaeon]
MAFEEWFIEHIVEIALLIVSLAGFGFAVKYLIKIEKNQKALLINSPNSQLVQITGNVTNSQITHFKEESKKVVAFSEEIREEETNAKKLISKIENYLDENKSISTISEMSLRLAKKLKMNDDEKWLNKEVRGYGEYWGDEEKNTGLKMKKSDKETQYRRIEAELNIGLKNGKIERFDIPMFISQPIRQIEEWVDRYSKEQRIVMNAPPMELMVKDLNVDPNEPVPYLVNPQSFRNILNGLRQRIIDFLDRAKNNVK